MERQEKAKLRARFFASLIDYIVIMCFFIIFVYKYGEPKIDGGYEVHGVKSLIPIGFWFIYLIVIESIFSFTVGHFIMGLKVVKDDYDRIDFIDSLKRHLIDPIDFNFFGIVAMILIKNTALNQRLGDIWAKTIVIKDTEDNKK